jgi:secreted trypsin-like serine protease
MPKAPTPINEAQHKALVRRCIAHAEAVAGTDDAAFVQALRARFFEEQATATRRLRPAAAGPRRGPTGDPSFRIFKDPRFLKNARELARRTQRGTRVIGGTTVTGKTFFDCVAVGNDQDWGCSGTLIARNVVLTAGHCADFATRVFFGRDVSKKGKIVRVAERVRHPEYHQKGKHNDLMVLVLETAVTGVAPRSVAPSGLTDAATDARVVGFGNTDPAGFFGYGIKRQTDVPIASPSCEGEVDGEEDRVIYGCDPALELIAGKPLLARDTCTGDSGGPLYVADPEGQWLLAGATSRATDSATNNCGDGGVYVRVDRYRDWIESIPGVDLP